jgi:hypothetical protein
VKNVGKEVYYFNLEEIGQKPQLSYPVAYLLGLPVEDSLSRLHKKSPPSIRWSSSPFSFKRAGRVLEVQGGLVKVMWEDGTVEWFSFSLQQWRASFECIRCGQVLSYWDVHLVYANKGRFECKSCGEISLPKPLLVEPSSGSGEKAGVFQNRSRKYERAKFLTSSPSGRLAVSGEKLIIKRKWLFPQGLIADYLKANLKEKGVSIKKLGEFMGRPHTIGHWLRKDFSHSRKGGSIPRPEDWLKLKEILGLDGIYDRLILDRVVVLSTVKSHPEGKNIGDVWEIATEPYKGEHFAVFPRKLVERRHSFRPFRRFGNCRRGCTQTRKKRNPH